jgi:hypothetical protein
MGQRWSVSSLFCAPPLTRVLARPPTRRAIPSAERPQESASSAIGMRSRSRPQKEVGPPDPRPTTAPSITLSSLLDPARRVICERRQMLEDWHDAGRKRAPARGLAVGPDRTRRWRGKSLCSRGARDVAPPLYVYAVEAANRLKGRLASCLGRRFRETRCRRQRRTSSSISSSPRLQGMSGRASCRTGIFRFIPALRGTLFPEDPENSPRFAFQGGAYGIMTGEGRP